MSDKTLKNLHFESLIFKAFVATNSSKKHREFSRDREKITPVVSRNYSRARV